MTGGYAGKILRVNLTEGKITEEKPSDELIKNYIGGRGWGIKILYDELEPHIDPLGPENKLVFTAGPLCGTKAQSFGRLLVQFKSPLTGIYCRSSAGGFFAAQMKFAGLDAIIVEGKAEKPVYVWIHDAEYEIRDAAELCDLGTVATEERIREEVSEPKARVMCIGPAGEKLGKMAAIVTDKRTAARGGGGAVMGSKNLKAIAVRGTGRVETAMPDLFKVVVGAQIAGLKASPIMAPGGFCETGTQLLPFTNALGMYPTKNFREGVLADWPKIGAEEYTKLRVKNTACYGCMIHCGSIIRMKGGKYNGLETEGPEYETIWSMSGPIGIADMGFTIAANEFCDVMGIDTVSAGMVLGFAYELYEKGIITKEDTDGLELKYGDSGVAMELLEKMVSREGFGDILAEGTRLAAQKIGGCAERYAIQVKGLELAGYDPRGAKAQGLNMLTSNIGASHCMGYSPQEIFNIPLPRPADRFGTEGKGLLTKYNQDGTAVLETGISCLFPWNFFAMTPGFYSKLLPAATGVMEFSDPNYLWKVGERIWDLERMFNVRGAGSISCQLLQVQILLLVRTTGPVAKQVFEQEQLLDLYYKARDWDVETGIPTKSKLNELGLQCAEEFGVGE